MRLFSSYRFAGRGNVILHHHGVLILLLLALSLTRFESISSFGLTDDEIQMFAIAQTCNEEGRLSNHGLKSNRGIYYGPFTIWIYQLFLVFTDNVGTMRIGAVILQSLAVGLSLVMVVTLCPFLIPLIGILVFLSPYFWVFSRLVWDFHIPLSALAFAFYLLFLKSKRFYALFLSGLFLLFGLLDHPKGFSGTAAILTHFILFRRTYLAKYWPHLVGISMVYLAIALPYLMNIFQHPEPVPYRFGGIASLGYTFSGAILFSAIDIGRYLGKEWYLAKGGSPLFLWLTYLTALIYFLWFGGLIYMARYVWKNFTGARDDPFKFEFCSLCLLVLPFLLFLNELMALVSYPHYFAPVWIYFFGIIWLFISEFWNHLLLRWVLLIYAVSMLITGIKIIHVM